MRLYLSLSHSFHSLPLLLLLFGLLAYDDNVDDQPSTFDLEESKFYVRLIFPISLVLAGQIDLVN